MAWNHTSILEVLEMKILIYWLEQSFTGLGQVLTVRTALVVIGTDYSGNVNLSIVIAVHKAQPLYKQAPSDILK